MSSRLQITLSPLRSYQKVRFPGTGYVRVDCARRSAQREEVFYMLFILFLRVFAATTLLCGVGKCRPHRDQMTSATFLSSLVAVVEDATIFERNHGDGFDVSKFN